jgi:hypothetical protein
MHVHTSSSRKTDESPSHYGTRAGLSATRTRLSVQDLHMQQIHMMLCRVILLGGQQHSNQLIIAIVTDYKERRLCPTPGTGHRAPAWSRPGASTRCLPSLPNSVTSAAPLAPQSWRFASRCCDWTRAIIAGLRRHCSWSTTDADVLAHNTNAPCQLLLQPILLAH